MKPIRRESRLTVGGFVYIAVSVFLAIGAINSQNNLLFWLFGVAIATLIVSGVFSGNALMQVRLKALSVSDGAAGETVNLHYVVRNNSKLFPLIAAVISEMPSLNHTNDAFPKGVYKPAALLHVGVHHHVRVHGTMTPEQRGRYSIRQIQLSTRFPFGLLHKSLIFECHRQMLVKPCKLAIKPGLVRIDQGHGEEVRKRTDATGMSNEYWGMRDYSPGDPMRSIAWKQSARQGSLVVIEHAVPLSSKLWIWIPALNRGRGKFEESVQLERAIALAASLIEQGTWQGVPVGLWAPGFGVQIQPSTGRRHIGRCLHALSLIDVAQGTQRDVSPPVAMNDDVIRLITSSQAQADSSPSRSLCMDSPADWLVDAHSLPFVLRVKDREASA